MEVKNHYSHSVHSFVQLICILCQHYCRESCPDLSEETVQRGLWTSKEQVTIGYEAFRDGGSGACRGTCVEQQNTGSEEQFVGHKSL